MATYYIDTYMVNKATHTTTLTRYMVRAMSVHHACTKAFDHMSVHHADTDNSADSRCTIEQGAPSHYPLVTINNRHAMTGTPHTYTYKS